LSGFGVFLPAKIVPGAAGEPKEFGEQCLFLSGKW